MSLTNLGFNYNEARKWKDDCDQVMRDVRDLLDQVHDTINDPVGNDTWMKAMLKIAEMEEQAWSSISDFFSTVSSSLATIFSTLGQTGQERAESLEKYKSRHQ